MTDQLASGTRWRTMRSHIFASVRGGAPASTAQPAIMKNMGTAQGLTASAK